MYAWVYNGIRNIPSRLNSQSKYIVVKLVNYDTTHSSDIEFTLTTQNKTLVQTQCSSINFSTLIHPKKREENRESWILNNVSIQMFIVSYLTEFPLLIYVLTLFHFSTFELHPQ